MQPHCSRQGRHCTVGLETDLDQLADRLPAGAVILDEDRMAGYRWDRANDPTAGTPAAVVRVSCTGDVQQVVRIAARHRTPVVVRGAGSGLSGGSTAIDGCIVISTERMRGIVIDPVTRTAVVEPGLFNGRGEEGGGRVRALVSAGPVLLRVLFHRGQRRDQCRWSVLREVRRHQ